MKPEHTRGSAFGSIIDPVRYDAVRPGYPAAAVSWLLGEPTAPVRVLDLGAGTGKLTRALVEHDHQVVAVDPAETMLQLLSASLPGVDTRVGAGEAIPLPDSAVDAVVVGQAWHWMDAQATGAELLRVVRPGGRIGLVWNVLDTRQAWVADLDRLTGDGDEAARESATAGPIAPEVPASFGAAQDRTFDNPHTLSRAELIDLVSTWSWVATHAERDEVINEVAALVDRVWGPNSTVTLPQACHCFRYQIAASFSPAS